MGSSWEQPAAMLAVVAERKCATRRLVRSTHWRSRRVRGVSCSGGGAGGAGLAPSSMARQLDMPLMPALM